MYWAFLQLKFRKPLDIYFIVYYYTGTLWNKSDLYRMISVQNMSVGYSNALLFHRLNFKMERGPIYGLPGLNGAGKTSLMKILSGLLYAKGGHVKVFGDNPHRRNPSLPEFYHDKFEY